MPRTRLRLRLRLRVSGARPSAPAFIRGESAGDADVGDRPRPTRPARRSGAARPRGRGCPARSRGTGGGGPRQPRAGTRRVWAPRRTATLGVAAARTPGPRRRSRPVVAARDAQHDRGRHGARRGARRARGRARRRDAAVGQRAAQRRLGVELDRVVGGRRLDQRRPERRQPDEVGAGQDLLGAHAARDPRGIRGARVAQRSGRARSPPRRRPGRCGPRPWRTRGRGRRSWSCTERPPASALTSGCGSRRCRAWCRSRCRPARRGRGSRGSAAMYREPVATCRTARSRAWSTSRGSRRSPARTGRRGRRRPRRAARAAEEAKHVDRVEGALAVADQRHSPARAARDLLDRRPHVEHGVLDVDGRALGGSTVCRDAVPGVAQRPRA